MVGQKFKKSQKDVIFLFQSFNRQMVSSFFFSKTVCPFPPTVKCSCVSFDEPSERF
jgi:hypothetical protein